MWWCKRRLVLTFWWFCGARRTELLSVVAHVVGPVLIRRHNPSVCDSFKELCDNQTLCTFSRQIKWKLPFFKLLHEKEVGREDGSGPAVLSGGCHHARRPARSWGTTKQTPPRLVSWIQSLDVVCWTNVKFLILSPPLPVYVPLFLLIHSDGAILISSNLGKDFLIRSMESFMWKIIYWTWGEREKFLRTQTSNKGSGVKSIQVIFSSDEKQKMADMLPRCKNESKLFQIRALPSCGVANHDVSPIR